MTTFDVQSCVKIRVHFWECMEVNTALEIRECGRAVNSRQNHLYRGSTV